MSMSGLPYPLGSGRASGTDGMTDQEAMMVRGVCLAITPSGPGLH